MACEYIAFCEQTQDYAILGHVDLNGVFHETPLTRAFKEGKFLLLDEVDSANSNTALLLNSIIDQRRMWDVKTQTMINAHEDFCVGAAGNTGGSGATNDYAGRNQQDGAFLNRFAKLAWQYDEKLERSIVLKQHRKCNDDLLAQIMSWVSRVQSIRKSALVQGSPILVTPRASIKGAAMIARGANTKLINMEDVYIFGDLDEDAKAAIIEGAK
jgi:MoxR-like ATPase